MAETTDYRAESLAGWERVAPVWERRADEQWRATEPVSRDLVDRLALRPGETVLELAGGIGQTGLLAAEAVGPGGRVISSDFAPAMVAGARRLAAQRGLQNVEHRVIDAEDIDLPDAAADAVLCRWGIMLMPNPDRALTETRRVLGPGGRLAFAVWAAPDANPWTTVLGRALVDRGALPPPEPGAPGMFALARKERIEELVRAAGFDSVAVHEVALTFEHESFEQYWDAILELSRAASEAFAALAPADREAVLADAQGRAAPYRTSSGGYTFPGSSLSVLAS